MFKHTTLDGYRNICGNKIKTLRLELPEKTSQRKLAEMFQLYGIDIDKTAIRRIESGERYVTDIELKIFCKIFDVSADFFILD